MSSTNDFLSGSVSTLNINNNHDSFVCSNFYFISATNESNLSKEIYVINHSSISQALSPICFEVGSVITIWFNNQVCGISSIKFRDLSPKINFYDGSTTQDITEKTIKVINGMGIVRRRNSPIRFVVVSATQIAAIETYHSYNMTDDYVSREVAYSNVVLNETSLYSEEGKSIAGGATASGVISPTFGEETLTSSNSLVKTGGWYPVCIAGYDCTRRFFLLTSCNLGIPYIVTYRNVNLDEEYVGWGASLDWVIYNPTSTSYSGLVYVTIMWVR